jgi:hypothetical protein
MTNDRRGKRDKEGQRKKDREGRDYRRMRKKNM